MTKKLWSLIPLFLFAISAVVAADGHLITVKLDNYDKDTLLLGYHYGEKQYIKDTVIINSEGLFVFEGTEELDPGVYIMVMPPDNQYFQVLINSGDQYFSLNTDATAPAANMKVKGSADNKLFYEYMDFLAAQRPKADAIKKKMEAEGADKAKLQGELEAVNNGVVTYQKDLINNHSETLAAAFVKSYMEVPMPEFEGSEQEIKIKRYHHYKGHYFDNINLGDNRLIRSPFLFQRVNYYMDKLTSQEPDSLKASVDYILGKTAGAEDTYKYFLVHFLNKYAQSNVVGMDAVYVHIAENYYATGKAPWTEDEQLKKIVDNAKTLKPILIGKIAPDIKMFEIDIEGTIEAENDENEYKRWRAKRELSLHEIKSPYTVIFVWDPDCGHCKKSMPKMLEFYDNFKDKGVEVFAVCSKTYDGIADCAKYIKEKNMIKWINAIDPFIKSKYKQIYDIKSTPQIFILDENKEILSKRIGAEQLSEVMEKIMEFKEKEGGNMK